MITAKQAREAYNKQNRQVQIEKEIIEILIQNFQTLKNAAYRQLLSFQQLNIFDKRLKNIFSEDDFMLAIEIINNILKPYGLKFDKYDDHLTHLTLTYNWTNNKEFEEWCNKYQKGYKNEYELMKTLRAKELIELIPNVEYAWETYDKIRNVPSEILEEQIEPRIRKEMTYNTETSFNLDRLLKNASELYRTAYNENFLYLLQNPHVALAIHDRLVHKLYSLGFIDDETYDENFEPESINNLTGAGNRIITVKW